MPNILEEKDWDLLRRIKNGKCTPFLGSVACSEKIPVISQIVNEWAREYDYPMEDPDDLTRVVQFVAMTEEDEMFPRDEVCNKITELSEEVTPTYFETTDEIHGVLAYFPLPSYITTTYDDLMVQALESRNFRIFAGYLERSTGRKHISVQLGPGNFSETREEKAQKYLDRYFEDLYIQVHWQDCHEFAAELKTRWEVFNGRT
ncbi:hypothetical protein [Methanosarcina acetivorans]|nr:hypothetical protein [Methanosarcina acetivorans]